MKDIIIREVAENDISNSYEWYEEKRKGLGANFMLCVDEAMSRISRNPKHYPTVLYSIRRALVKRFPYGVFYIEEDTKIVVLAVMHVRQNPKKWKGRTHT